MANNNDLQMGGSGDLYSVGNGETVVLRKVFDIAEAIASADGLNSGDNIVIAALPSGTVFEWLDAEIVETLSIDSGASNLINIGSTVGDPDEYVDGQANTAVGRFTAYVAGHLVTAVLTADTTLYLGVTGDKLSDGTADATGKIAVTFKVTLPAKETLESAKHRTYTN